MEKELLVREVKQIALTRMEDSARTVSDFRNVQKQWDAGDNNRLRNARRHEISRPNEEMLHWDKPKSDDRKGKLRSRFGLVIPIPLNHPYWRQLIRGDFLDTIFDNPEEMWKVVANKEISKKLKKLTTKQKEVIFLSAVRQCTPQQIACYKNITDRAVRKLLTATLEKLRKKTAPTLDKSDNRMV
jgi:RNA polymerase sigma factor (sigma-70 family)